MKDGLFILDGSRVPRDLKLGEVGQSNYRSNVMRGAGDDDVHAVDDDDGGDDDDDDDVLLVDSGSDATLYLDSGGSSQVCCAC